MSQAVTDLKAQVTRLSADIKAAVIIITNPSSDDAEVAAAAQALRTLADSLEAVGAGP